MKKILLFASLLFLALTPGIVKAQTITNVAITSPIICNGDLATVKIDIAQTVPATQLRCMVGYYSGANFIAVDTTITNGVLVTTQLPAGNYNIRLVDMLNTSIVFNEWAPTVSITQPLNSVNIDTVVVSEITCRDLDDASITINASGGQLPYSYSITNGFTQVFANSFSPLSPNIYITHVEDNLGCISRDTIEIVNPDSLYIDTTIFTDVNCYGACDGTVQSIVAYGGTAPYRYSVNGGTEYTHTAYFNGYCPGMYTIEVFDDNNCAAQDIIFITQPDELLVDITTSLWNSYQIQCNGDNSGLASLALTGGTAPYNIVCTDNSGNIITNITTNTLSNTISNLSADTYTFTITDAKGCVVSETIIYNEPPAIVHNFIATHVSCNGWSNGALTDAISGGVGTATSYSYSWNTGDTTYSLASIPVGTYTMTVVDDNACVSTDSYIINDANALNVTYTATDVSCHDYCDGEIAALVTGGIPMIDNTGASVYTYAWDDVLSQTTATAVGLCADNTTNSTLYTCVVTDLIGCSDTITYNLVQPEPLEVTISVLTPISCNLGDDGRLRANPIGGNGGYSYYWNDGATTIINSNLSSGTYVVVVEDNKGCLDTADILFEEPTAMEISTTSPPVITHVSCYGFDDGSITIDIDGGTVIGFQEYIYTWSPTNLINLTEQVKVSTASDLAPGVYTVVVTDANGCSFTSEEYYITQPENPLSIAVEYTDETCNIDDGTGTAFILGGTTPYTILWNGTLGASYNTGLTPGHYDIDVTDANGCVISDAIYIDGIHNVFLPGNLSVINSTICLGASVFLEIDEKSYLSYEWEDGSKQADRTVTPPQGTTIYTLTITDPACPNAPYSVTATITAVPVPALPMSTTADGNDGHPTIVSGSPIEIYADNTTCDAYEWSWATDTIGNRTITDYPTESGWYYIAVEKAGCLGYDSIYVVVGVLPYDAFSPNNDGYNDTWSILDIASYPNAVVQIFNRWGALIFETKGGDSYEAWDGTRNGEELPIGTYYYVVDLNTDDEPQTGPITIIR